MSGSPAPQPEHSEADGAESTRARLAILAVVITAVWYVCLVSLIVLTDRPVAVNLAQILESQLVVSGSVDADGIVTIDRVLKGSVADDVLQISEPLSFPPGDWILPLLRTGHGFEVTPTRLPNNTTLAYPVNDDVIGQIEAVLSDE